jgi:hypothetical protein
MKVSKVAIAVCYGLSVSACGIADHYKAQDRMEKSKDACTKCVAENLSDPSQCDPLKAIYEKDKAEYEKT